jgi:Peptidase family C25/FlgD Ig-like domain
MRIGLGLVVMLALVPSQGRAAAPVRLATVQLQDANRVVFRVNVPDARLIPSGALKGTERIEIDGYNRTGTPGAPPTLTHSFLIGLPPEGTYSLSYRLITTTPLGTHRLEPVARPIGIHDEELGPDLSERVEWNDEIFNAYRDPELVIADPVVYIRHQRALPVRVNPLAYDPKSQTLSVAKVIEIEVRFGGAPRGNNEGFVAADEGKDWNDTYARLLVNASQSKAWRVRAVPTLNQTMGAARVVPGAVKIHVYQTGMHTVRASRAIAAGFPAGQPVANLRVFRRTYNESTFAAGETEIACEVNEDPSGTAGVFDGNDDLVFYGRRLRDDLAQGDTTEQYSAYNAYWLEPSNGTRMAQTAPGVGFVTTDTTAAAFPAQDHFEIDNVFRDGTPPGLPGPEDLYYFNFGNETAAVDMPFTVGNIQPGTTLALSAELDGQTYDAPRSVRISLVNAKGETLLNATYPVPGKLRRTFSAAVPSANLDLGVNKFRFDLPDQSRSMVQVLLNFVDVSYSSLFRARGNTLRFNSASLVGDTTITVTGITSVSGLELFDITNPDQPERLVLSAGHFQSVGGGTALSFRRSYATRHQYMLIPDARMVDVKAADIAADTPSSIIGGSAESGVDVLVVAHHDFMQGMRQWTSYRRAQGYRVLLVDVDDVFDEFNGGVPHARAVYRFARHFFEHGNAGTLVLVGDASEDHKHIHDDSGTNFVPTYTRLENVSVLQLDEVVTTDKRFVKFPAPGGGVDEIPDMIVGRIPVGDPSELQTVLDKVYLYEAPTASDFWRKRMIMVADDGWSEGQSTFGGLQFCYNYEDNFENGQEQASQTIENSLPAGYDVVRFFLRTYTDSFYPPYRPPNTPPCANRFAAIAYVRQNATEKLMNELNQGATLFTIQAHMNRYVVTHERLISGEPASILNGSTGRDYLRVENRFKPWIVVAMGCHFSQYAINREFSQANLIYNSPNGDSFAEQYLFQEERGAVGTYGSAGFEYLDANNSYMNTLTSVWFYSAPYDTMTAQTQAEWKLGQLMFLTEAEMAVSGQAGPVERYHILGDPLLRIDAGPPAFNVTVNGHPARSGDVIGGGGGGGQQDTISVVATVTDENAIHKFSLEIDGKDESDSLKVVRLSDPTLPHARQYRVSFHHVLMPRTYDIVLRAYQSPDTTAGQYHMAAEFRLKVESSISVSVDGRTIQSGASVPADGDYRIDMTFPVFIPSSAIAISIDNVAVTNAQYAHPSAQDSLSWIVTFRKNLGAGKHHMLVDAQGIQFNYQLVVSESAGLRNVINYPNPFASDGTRFLYTNDVEIETGSIDIYTVSGKKVRRLDIPTGARPPGQNSVFWDGRDASGGTLANGVYLFVINVHQRSGNATVRGSTNKIQ